MPTYPYACTACGHAFEVQQSFSDPSLTECPECAGRLRKVFSSVGVVFKGSGFYRNDSRPGSGSDAGVPSTAGAGSSGSDNGSGTGSTGTKAAGSGSGSGAAASKPAATTSSAPAAAASS